MALVSVMMGVLALLGLACVGLLVVRHQRALCLHFEHADARLDGAVRDAESRLGGRIDRVDIRLDATLRDEVSRMTSMDRELQAVHDAALQMQEIARGVSRFAEILGTPAARGRFGEVLLERLLAQVLPGGSYAVQHRFSDGRAVDAVIRLGSGVVPVDAKFPLDAYARLRETQEVKARARLWREFSRTVRGHVDAVAGYIRPDESTLEFALMYVPAEAVYYECFVKPESPNDEDLQQFALERRVIPVSPNSFFGYLQAIALGLRGLRVEEEAQQILAGLGRLTGEFGAFRTELGVLGGHVNRSKNKYDELAVAAERIEVHLRRSAGDRRDDPSGGPELERPAADGLATITPSSHRRETIT